MGLSIVVLPIPVRDWSLNLRNPEDLTKEAHSQKRVVRPPSELIGLIPRNVYTLSGLSGLITLDERRIERGCLDEQRSATTAPRASLLLRHARRKVQEFAWHTARAWRTLEDAAGWDGRWRLSLNGQEHSPQPTVWNFAALTSYTVLGLAMPYG